MDPGLAGYEEVRRKLRERGYLDGRIERFVLKDLLGPGSYGRHLVRSGLKAALLAAPLLGAVLAAAAVAANRPLVGAADGFVLWLWFSLLCGCVLFVLDLGAAVAVAALAGRRGARPADTLRAAAMVGLPVLGYLAALWGVRRSAADLLADAAFLAAALAAVMLAAWLAGLVSLAGIVGRTGQVPGRQRRFVVLLAGILLPAIAAGFALASIAGRAGGAGEPSPFEPGPGAARLLFVGVDGLDGELVQALAERGGFAKLLAGMESGAVFPKRREAGPEPPEVWTTVLTGMPASAHGVRAVGAARLPGVATPLLDRAGPAPLGAALRFLLPGRTVPSSGAGRTVRTLWEIAALRRKAAAVGWWASWPVRDGEGARVISDRVLSKLLAGAAEGDRDTAPASLFDRLRSDFPEDRRAARSEFEARFGRASGGPFGRLLWESYLIDFYALRVAGRLGSEPSVSACFVYLPGLDILRGRIAAARVERGLSGVLDTQEAVETYARALDALLGEVLERDGAVVIVADPGRAATAESEGFILVRGGGAEAGCVGPRVSDLDVAPLVLGLLGFPASREMPGAPPGRCLGAAFPREATRIATYGRRAVAAEAARSAFDREMVERLRSLGYLR